MEPSQSQPPQQEEIKAPPQESAEQTEKMDPAVEAELLKNIKNLPFLQGNPLQKPRIFWDTQPVPRFTDYENVQSQISGPLEEKQSVENVRKEGLPLPEHFEWCDVNLLDDKEAQEVYELLRDNYVEDDDNMFRFDYSIEFLRWAVVPPNYYKEWLAGVRVKKSKKLVGFITAIPLHLMVEDKKVKMCEVNFLCVHKKLRKNRLAPVLIKEITRRVHLKNLWQAIYTAGVLIPTPFGEARYYHRSLNPKKLIESNFSSLGKNQTLARMIKLYKLPEKTQIEGLRPMKTKDVAPLHKLLNEYLTQFKVYTKYSEEEIKHWLLPRKDVIYTYVVEKEKKVTDFFSFYSLPSSILKHPVHKTLRAAYSYYNVATSVPVSKLINEALVVAYNEGFDVFNALDIMDNKIFLDELKFSPGDGNLHYYLYNWKMTSTIKPGEIGIVLV